MNDSSVIPPIQERYDLRLLTTFKPNKHIPIHNWVYFKEGFARDFVKLALSWMHVKQGIILDPFVGVGTTTLVARELGLSSIGVDVSPLMILITRAKCRDYEIERLRQESTKIFGVRFSRPDLGDVPTFVKPYFNRYTLEDVIFFRKSIQDIQDDAIREFLLVALISAAMKASYVYKDGSLLRIVKKPVPPFRKFLKAKVRRMIRDLSRSNLPGPESKLFVGDARILRGIDGGSIDAIVTSPPYLNKIEYTKVYGLEYALFLPGHEPEPIRSYVGTVVKNGPLSYPELPPVANAYFDDMRSVLNEMKRVLKEGGKATIVLAGGVFPNVIVNSDILLANMAAELEFKVHAIITLNKRVATRDRIEKIGWARESAVIIERPPQPR